MLLAGPAHAEEAIKPLIKVIHSGQTPTFGLPLDCTYGKDCLVLNYTDFGIDSTGNPQDPYCQARTYEGHKGTDFALKDEVAMLTGVNVLAAADGTILKTRDGEPDRFPTDAEIEQVKADRKECGNAILMEHTGLGDGKWQTMYCHLKKGSVTVKPGQTVRKGEKIAQAGMSGMTQFPHLHFGLVHNSKVVDPFTGSELQEGCGTINHPLWDESLHLAYDDAVIFTTGFDTSPPSLDALDRKQIANDKYPRDIPALVFYAVIFGAREDDNILLTITAPDGSIFARNNVAQKKNRARQLYYLGREITSARALQKGEYKGKVVLTRKDKDGKDHILENADIISIE